MTELADNIRNVADYVQLPLLYQHWYVAGLCEEFDRTPKDRTLLERSIVFYRTLDGQLVAAQNRCLHRSFPLSEGSLEGDNLVCGYHGIRYDPEGRIVRIPSQQRCPDRKLRMYPVVENGPFVFIWMGDEDEPDLSRLPDLPFLTDPGYRTFLDAHHIKASYLLMQENLNDLTHFSYLHRNSFGFDDSFLELPTTVEETTEGVSCYRVDTNPQNATAGLPPDIQERIAGRPAERWDGGLAISPGVFKGHAPINVGDPDSEDFEVFNSYIMHYVTPETATTSHYWWSISNDYGIDNDPFYEFAKPMVRQGFGEDAWAVDHVQNLLDNDTHDYQEIVIGGDKAGLLFRRIVLSWVEAEYGQAGTDPGLTEGRRGSKIPR